MAVHQLFTTTTGTTRHSPAVTCSTLMRCTVLSARVAAELVLLPSGRPGPASVLITSPGPGGAHGLAAPLLVQVHSYACPSSWVTRSARPSSISPMDMDLGECLILGWDWISSLLCAKAVLTPVPGKHTCNWTSYPLEPWDSSGGMQALGHRPRGASSAPPPTRAAVPTCRQ